MQIKDIYAKLDEISPFQLQEKWDNSGLIIGSMDDIIKNVYISLDLDLELVSNLESNSLIITHHPLIFSPLKTINDNIYATKILKILIKKDISLISMHTNIDKTHLNKYVGKDILKLDFIQEDDFILSCHNLDIKFEDIILDIKKKLNIETLKVVKNHENISSVSLTTGSGMSLIDNVTTDLFLTGDIKYHDAMEATARGISLIDIGHYESEKYFTQLINYEISDYLKLNEIKAIMLDSQNPFKYF